MNSGATAFVLVVLFILILAIVPLVTLASINTIFEQGGISYYIPHNLWTYLSVWGLMLVFKSGTSSYKRG